MRLTVLFLVAFGIVCSARAAQQRLFFSPSDTDSAITQFNNNHFAVVDPALPSRGRLLVFLPGTGAVPFNYTDFVENAASLGFHGLGLMYPNPVAINELVTQNDPLNPNAALNARLEVIDGIDRVSYVTVGRIDCIENRLLKALQYLHATNPTRGWNQFFAGTEILWNKLVLCGHSQGGGHAGVVAKTRVVARCLLFGSMDFWYAGNRPYNWMSMTPETGVPGWFALVHERNQVIDLLKAGHPNMSRMCRQHTCDRGVVHFELRRG
jgi:hypothetical protein